MAISSSSKFKVFYCSTGLPTQEAQINVGGLYVYNDAIYLCKDYADSKATWEKLDGLPQGANNPASGVAGEYFFNTGDKVLYYWDGTAWTGAQAKALSQQVLFTITDGAQENPVTIATGSMAAGSTQATLTVSGVPAAKITAGALANGMTATTQGAKDNSTKIATTAYVDTAISTAAVAVMHYKGTVADTDALEDIDSPAVGDVYNLASDGSNWAYSSATNYTPSGTAGTDYIAIGSPATGYWEKLGSTLDTSDFAHLTGGNLISGNQTITGDVTLSGENSDLSVGGTLGVTGASTLGTVQAGATTVGTSGTNADLTVNGNETVSGTLGVTGATTLSTVSTSGLATLASASVTGNETVGGTLGVTGATTLSNTLSVGSTSALAGNVTIGATGAGNGADLTVNGAITATGDISGDDISGATISTSGNATIGGDVEATGAVSGASLSVTGAVSGASLTTTGTAGVGTNLTVGGTSALGGNVTIGTTGDNGVPANLLVTGTFDVDGAADFDGAVDMTGSSAVSLGANATATTKNQGDNSTSVATTAYVDTAITNGLTWTLLS